MRCPFGLVQRPTTSWPHDMRGAVLEWVGEGLGQTLSKKRRSTSSEVRSRTSELVLRHRRSGFAWRRNRRGDFFFWTRRHRRIARRTRHQVERAIHAAEVLVVGVAHVCPAVMTLKLAHTRLAQTRRAHWARGNRWWRVVRALDRAAVPACRETSRTERDTNEEGSTKVFHARRETRPDANVESS